MNCIVICDEHDNVSRVFLFYLYFLSKRLIKNVFIILNIQTVIKQLSFVTVSLDYLTRKKYLYNIHRNETCNNLSKPKHNITYCVSYQYYHDFHILKLSKRIKCEKIFRFYFLVLYLPITFGKWMLVELSHK